ncbi:hypothetical protein OH77DRAFT_1189499 [Trametes cingulata]|nr:hypothetical protein OH77DRAFT_1189499 [Trametes cingulata]
MFSRRGSSAALRTHGSPSPYNSQRFCPVIVRFLVNFASAVRTRLVCPSSRVTKTITHRVPSTLRDLDSSPSPSHPRASSSPGASRPRAPAPGGPSRAHTSNQRHRHGIEEGRFWPHCGWQCQARRRRSKSGSMIGGGATQYAFQERQVRRPGRPGPGPSIRTRRAGSRAC